MNVSARENRLRKKASRNGLKLIKSRVRDPSNPLFGRYQVIDVSTGIPAANIADHLGRGYPFDSIDEVEKWLGKV